MTKSILLAATAAIAVGTSPAMAATNLIKNGSFEQGGAGVNGFTGWTKLNVPDNNPRQDQPASIITYNNNSSYPNGAYGERVSADNTASASPDAVGNKAAYFVGDFSNNETISQLTYLGVGNYRVGFSYYLTQNGLNNRGNSSVAATIIGLPVASTVINSSSTAKVWRYASGVGQITKAGWYDTSFVFNSNLAPSKDVVIDRVFALRTKDAANVIIPGTPTGVPEPATWAMFGIGFGLAGSRLRRRKTLVAA